MSLVHLCVFSWVALLVAGTTASASGKDSLLGLLFLSVWGLMFLAIQVLVALTAIRRQRESHQPRGPATRHGHGHGHALLEDFSGFSTAASGPG